MVCSTSSIGTSVYKQAGTFPPSCEGVSPHRLVLSPIYYTQDVPLISFTFTRRFLLDQLVVPLWTVIHNSVYLMMSSTPLL